jgi:uncharacterized membrane protein
MPELPSAPSRDWLAARLGRLSADFSATKAASGSAACWEIATSAWGRGYGGGGYGGGSYQGGSYGGFGGSRINEGIGQRFGNR